MSYDVKQVQNDVTRLQRGVTLIEALVTLFVLSVGLVGIAALHLNSMQNAHSSYYRSLASVIALDFEERLWITAANELSNPGQCLTDVNGDNKIVSTLGELTTAWDESSGLPGLEVFIDVQDKDTVVFTRAQPGAAGISIGNWTDRWEEMTVTIKWTEGRFTSDPAGTERFDYVLRIPCVSQYTPGSTP